MAAKRGQRKSKAKVTRKGMPVVTKPVYGKGQAKQAAAKDVLPVTIPAPRTDGWAQRTWRNLTGGRDEGMREHLAAVKAGVMHELESLSAEKGVQLSGQPFRNVVLPQIRRRRPWLWPMVIGTALALVVVMVLVGRKPGDPAVALHQVMLAVQNHNVAAFEEHVDVAAVASSVVNQVFSVPQLNVEALPPELQEKLQGGVGARMTTFIKPGLAESLKDEVLQAVKDGHVASEDEQSLLVRIWDDLGGQNVRLGQIHVAMQDTDLAVAEVPVERMDLGLTLPLQVVLNKGVDGKGEWQVADVPNFAAVLETMAGATSKRQKREEVMAAAVVNGKVAISDVRKAKAVIDGILLTMTVSNVSNEEVRDLQVKVAFGDAAGQPLKVTDLIVDGVLKPHESREQTWTVPIDRSRPVERYVLDLPLSALSVKVVPIGGGQAALK